MPSLEASRARPQQIVLVSFSHSRRAPTGDERCVELLLTRYRHFARAKARKYFLMGRDKEDVVQEAMIAGTLDSHLKAVDNALQRVKLKIKKHIVDRRRGEETG